jgi:hypothetical protein
MVEKKDSYQDALTTVQESLEATNMEHADLESHTSKVEKLSDFQTRIQTLEARLHDTRTKARALANELQLAEAADLDAERCQVQNELARSSRTRKLTEKLEEEIQMLLEHILDSKPDSDANVSMDYNAKIFKGGATQANRGLEGSEYSGDDEEGISRMSIDDLEFVKNAVSQEEEGDDSGINSDLYQNNPPLPGFDFDGWLDRLQRVSTDSYDALADLPISQVSPLLPQLCRIIVELEKSLRGLCQQAQQVAGWQGMKGEERFASLMQHLNADPLGEYLYDVQTIYAVEAGRTAPVFSRRFHNNLVSVTIICASHTAWCAVSLVYVQATYS